MPTFQQAFIFTCSGPRHDTGQSSLPLLGRQRLPPATPALHNTRPSKVPAGLLLSTRVLLQRHPRSPPQLHRHERLLLRQPWPHRRLMLRAASVAARHCGPGWGQA